jgi:hypothetical protein
MSNPRLAIALSAAARGFAVFPFRLGAPDAGGHRSKAPLTAHWKEDATTDEASIRAMWEAHPDAWPGWSLPEGYVVADIDDREAFGATGLELPDAPCQATPSGGEHRLYKAIGARQVVKKTPGLDTRVGGKGFVGLYAIDAFAGEVPDAPAWLLHRGPPATVAPLDGKPEQLGTRDDILDWGGSLRGVFEADVLAMLLGKRERGEIVALDPDRPWDDKSLRVLAGQIAKWAGEPLWIPVLRFVHRAKQSAVLADGLSLVTIDARDLLATEFHPLVEPVPGLVVEGLGMLIGGPKKGKSWLAYQFAVAVATEGETLGVRAMKGDVLYLALEDGERRAKSRIETVLRHLGTTWPTGAVLEIGFNAERGDALVEQVEEWLTRHPAARLVIVDTLQKIRPASSGRRNQYELDVEDLGRMLAITQRHPGLAILLVHHDRKQVSPDFLDAASGTHGITGSVDTALVLKRERLDSQGTLEVTGRDVRERMLWLAYDEDQPFWAIDPAGGLTEEQREVWEWLKDNGPAGPTAIGAAVGMDKSNVHHMLVKMVARRMLLVERGLYRLPFSIRHSNNGDNRNNVDNPDNADNVG